MAASVTHQKVSTVPPTADPDLVSSDDWNDEHEVTITAADVGAAPNTGVDYLVGTASGSLTGEIAVGTSPGGELGGTWASPTVDATHSGSTHGAAVTTHEAAADPHTGYVREDLFDAAGDLVTATADNTPSKLTKGTQGQVLAVGASTIGYEDRHTQISFSKSGTVAVTTESSPVHHWTNDTGRTLTIVKVRARAEVGPSGTTQVIDINMDGTTIFTSTKVVLPDSTGGVSTVLTTSGFAVTTIADGHLLSMNVDATLATGLANLTVTVWMTG